MRAAGGVQEKLILYLLLYLQLYNKGVVSASARHSHIHWRSALVSTPTRITYKINFIGVVFIRAGDEYRPNRNGLVNGDKDVIRYTQNSLTMAPRLWIDLACGAVEHTVVH